MCLGIGAREASTVRGEKGKLERGEWPCDTEACLKDFGRRCHVVEGYRYQNKKKKQKGFR